MKKRCFLGALLLCTSFSSSLAQSENQPPSPRPSLFTRNDALWSAAFLGASIALSRADARIAHRWNDSTLQSSNFGQSLARNFAKVQEGSLTVGNVLLYGIGRLAKVPALSDITFHAAEAVVVGSFASQVIRGPLGRSRPHVTNNDDPYDFHYFRGFREFKYRAFPSIHTASAFAVATVYTLETQRRAPEATWIVGPVAYLIASGPGIARMYQGQHWASDVLAGAFLGTLAGIKVMRYNHDVKPDNRLNRFFLGTENVQVGVGDSGMSIVVGRNF